MRLLLVEDHRVTREMVRDYLRTRGFAVDEAASGRDAMAAVEVRDYDAVVLDLGLPDLDGLEVLPALRDRPEGALPVLVLTARDELADRVHGLDHGADDYVSKPFALTELEARIRAVLRRPGARRPTVVSRGSLSFDPSTREATVAGRPVGLTRREAAALEELLSTGGRVLVRDVLLDRLYDEGAGFGADGVGANALEAVISRLRRKLAEAEAPVRVETVRGIGYRLVDDDRH